MVKSLTQKKSSNKTSKWVKEATISGLALQPHLKKLINNSSEWTH